MIRILDRYLLRELVSPFLVGMAAFTVVLLSSTLFMYVRMIVERGLTTALVSRLLLLSLPANLVAALPVAYMLATMLVMGRLARDSEMTALRASGVSLGRIIAPILLGAILVSYLAWAINERVVPWNNHQMNRIYAQIFATNPAPIIQPNLFFPGTNNRFFYVERVDKDVLRDLIIFDLSRQVGFPQVITAKKAVWQRSRWLLSDGMMRTFAPSGYIKYEAAFQQMELHLAMPNNAELFAPKGIRELSAGEAYEAIKRAEAAGDQGVNAMRMDYHLKYALPLATFFTSLLSVPIGILFSRIGSIGGVAAGIAIIFVWEVLYSFGGSLGSAGKIPPVLAAWNQNILFGAIGLGLLLWINRK